MLIHIQKAQDFGKESEHTLHFSILLILVKYVIFSYYMYELFTLIII